MRDITTKCQDAELAQLRDQTGTGNLCCSRHREPCFCSQPVAYTVAKRAGRETGTVSITNNEGIAS